MASEDISTSIIRGKWSGIKVLCCCIWLFHFERKLVWVLVICFKRFCFSNGTGVKNLPTVLWFKNNLYWGFGTIISGWYTIRNPLKNFENNGGFLSFSVCFNFSFLLTKGLILFKWTPYYNTAITFNYLPSWVEVCILTLYIHNKCPHHIKNLQISIKDPMSNTWRTILYFGLTCDENFLKNFCERYNVERIFNRVISNDTQTMSLSISLHIHNSAEVYSCTFKQ